MKSLKQVKHEAGKIDTAIIKLRERLFNLYKTYAEQSGKFKKDDIVYRSVNNQKVYYQVQSYIFNPENNVIMYRLIPVFRGKYIKEFPEEVLEKSVFNIDMIKETTSNTGGYGRRHREYAANPARVIQYMQDNPNIKVAEVARYFNTSHATINNYQRMFQKEYCND